MSYSTVKIVTVKNLLGLLVANGNVAVPPDSESVHGAIVGKFDAILRCFVLIRHGSTVCVESIEFVAY